MWQESWQDRPEGRCGDGRPRRALEVISRLDFITRWKPLKGVKHGNTQI